MCGIAGFISFRHSRSSAELEQLGRGMAEMLAHRGPDGAGTWVDPAAGLALAHRRLAILDLSEAGRQPMTSASGRYVITYNGEVFNFQELRRELAAAGHHFQSDSDTEVILEAFDAWGVQRAVERFVGMFAFALWDRCSRRLTLVRDRLGIKPLFCGWHHDVFFFASQPKAFFAHPSWRPEIDSDALSAYLRFNYVPAPHSIWKGIRKLRPGHLLTVNADKTEREVCYWDLPAIAAQSIRQHHEMQEVPAADELEALLREAVRLRLVADVHLGAFLSGGVDSGTVVALMQEQSNRPIKTFTIGFSQRGYDEASHAKAVAAHLGTEHHELYVDPDALPKLVPELPEYFDEPFADPSEVPTLMLARLTRKSVTVALSGDGGDEIFAGYARYAFVKRFARILTPLPLRMRRAAAAAIGTIPASAYDLVHQLMVGRQRPSLIGDRAHKLADLLPFRSPEELYERLITAWHEPSVLVSDAQVRPLETRAEAAERSIPDLVSRLQLTDQMTYLPDWVLAKTDRASMAVGLEARVPLLDHRVVEFGWRLPVHLRRSGGRNKILLRRVLARFVPQTLIDRPKMGFEPPVGIWIKGPLRTWAEDLLSSRSLANGGLLDPVPVRRRFAEHLSCQRNWQYSLWGILMFQAWQQRWASWSPSACARGYERKIS